MPALLTTELRGATLVATPSTDLNELAFEHIESDAREILQLLEQSRIKNVIFDFRNTDYYGSTALSFFVKVFKRVRLSGGVMAFCNVSEHEREILQITRLDTLWSVVGTLEEALAQTD